jgi:hypothetical protein
MRTFAASLILGLCAILPASAFVPQPVPEPATMILVGGGLAAAILVARRQRNRRK